MPAVIGQMSCNEGLKAVRAHENCSAELHSCGLPPGDGSTDVTWLQMHGPAAGGRSQFDEAFDAFRTSLPSFSRALSPTAVRLALGHPVQHQRQGISTQIAAMSMVSTSAKPLYDLCVP